MPSGGDRADFVYLTLDQLGKRYPGVPLAGLAERGGAALVLVSGDLTATEKALGSAAVRSGTCDLRAAGQGQRHPARLHCRLI